MHFTCSFTSGVVHCPQSAGHEEHVSPLSHAPLPQAGISHLNSTFSLTPSIIVYTGYPLQELFHSSCFPFDP